MNVYINYEKKFAFVEFRTGESSLEVKPPQPCLREPNLCILSLLSFLAVDHCGVSLVFCTVSVQIR